MKNQPYTKLDVSLLMLRIGIGFMFILHGYPKLFGGTEKWLGLGNYGMGAIGIHFYPILWGFLAAFSECIGGLMIVLGAYARFFAFLIFITMVVAALTHIINGDGVMGASHAIESAFIFIFLFIMGPGRIRLIN